MNITYIISVTKKGSYSGSSWDLAIYGNPAKDETFYASETESQFKIFDSMNNSNYFCDICGEKFAHARNMTRHKIIHTGSKPFECDICGTRFNRHDNLKTHKKSKHRMNFQATLN